MLLAAGYRCISYDRRGFGQSSQPTTGYDYDTFAADLKALLDHLALDRGRRPRRVLDGHRRGDALPGHLRVRRCQQGRAVRRHPAVPAADRRQPQGRPGRGVRRASRQAIVADRYAYFDDFFANFYNTDVLAPERIGDAALRASFQVAAGAGPYATYACVDSWLTDFRGDLPKIDVPTLVVHGTADRILPFEATAARLRDEKLIADLTVVEVADGPHNIGWTHPDEVNSAFLSFLRR